MLSTCRRFCRFCPPGSPNLSRIRFQNSRLCRSPDNRRGTFPFPPLCRGCKSRSICPNCRNGCPAGNPCPTNTRALRNRPFRRRFAPIRTNRKPCFPHREYTKRQTSRDFCTASPRGIPYRRRTRTRHSFPCRRAKNRRNISLRMTRCRPLCTVRTGTSTNSIDCPARRIVFPYSRKPRIRRQPICPDNRTSVPRRRICTNTFRHRKSAPRRTTTFRNKRNRPCRRRLSPPDSRTIRPIRISRIYRRNRICCRPRTNCCCICKPRRVRQPNIRAFPRDTPLRYKRKHIFLCCISVRSNNPY